MLEKWFKKNELILSNGKLYRKEGSSSGTENGFDSYQGVTRTNKNNKIK